MTLEDWKSIANKQPKKRIYLRKINEGELEYWQDLVKKSNSIGDVFKLHNNNKTHFPKRSEAWLYKYLDLPFVLSAEKRKVKVREQRVARAEEYIKSLTFIDKVISVEYPEMGETKISYVCKEGHFHPHRMLRNLKSCSVCSSKKRKQKVIERRIHKEKERNEQRKQRKISKEKEFSDRLKRVDEFFQNSEWKNFEGVTDWPIKNDINTLRKYSKFKYETEYNQITYFEYKSKSAKPPIEPKENHKWCRYCREEKHFDDFPKSNNICKTCAQEYRRENYAEKERNSMRERYHSDPVHRIGSVIKSHINHILNNKFDKIRDETWEETVGLSKQAFLDYILEQCEPHWNMDNYGKVWVIQHIVPRDFAEVESDAYLLNYYKNLMPWGFSENAALKNRIEPSQLNEWHYTNERIQQLIQTNSKLETNDKNKIAKNSSISNIDSSIGI